MKDPNVLQAKELKKGDLAVLESNMIADVKVGVLLAKGETVLCLEAGSKSEKSLFLCRLGFIHLWGINVRMLS